MRIKCICVHVIFRKTYSPIFYLSIDTIPVEMLLLLIFHIWTTTTTTKKTNHARVINYEKLSSITRTNNACIFSFFFIVILYHLMPIINSEYECIIVFEFWWEMLKKEIFFLDFCFKNLYFSLKINEEFKIKNLNATSRPI